MILKMEIEEKICTILTDIKQMEGIRDKKLVSDGLLDSFDMIRLVGSLENEFGIKIQGDEINLENFDTVAAISMLVQKSQQGT